MDRYEKFARDNDIVLICKKIKERFDTKDLDCHGNHWMCILKKEYREYIFYYTKGFEHPDGKPSISEVFMDFAHTTIYDGFHFKNWVDVFGFESYSSKMLDLYNNYMKQNKDLKFVLGEDGFYELMEVYKKGE